MGVAAVAAELVNNVAVMNAILFIFYCSCIEKVTTCYRFSVFLQVKNTQVLPFSAVNRVNQVS